MTRSFSKIIIGVILFFLVVFTARAANTSLTFEIIAVPQCSDGGDNDGDTLVDYPNDPGCSSLSDDSENTVISSGGGGGGGSSGKRSSKTTSNDSSDGENEETLVDITDPAISFKGLAPEGVIIILFDNGTIVGATKVSGGNYEVGTSGIDAGFHNFQVRAIMPGLVSPVPYSYSAYLQSGTLSLLSGSDIGVMASVETLGGDTIVSGISLPFTNVRLSAVGEPNDFTLSRSTTEVGSFSFTFNQVVPSGYITLSALNQFGQTIGAPVLVKINQGLVTDASVPACKTGDVNFDGKVNVFDFVLVKLWQKEGANAEALEREAACLDNNGIIDLYDYHVIALNWTG